MVIMQIEETRIAENGMYTFRILRQKISRFLPYLYFYFSTIGYTRYSRCGTAEIRSRNGPKIFDLSISCIGGSQSIIPWIWIESMPADSLQEA